jgi:hypothetical protein
MFRRNHAQSTTRRRLFLESLETRNLLANFSWTLGTDGDFSNAAAWTETSPVSGVHAVPGASDNASIPGGITVTNSASRSVNSVNGTLNLTAGTLTVANVGQDSGSSGLQVASGASLKTTGGETSISGAEIHGNLDSEGLGVTRFRHNDNNLYSGMTFTGNGQFLISGDTFGGPNMHLLGNVVAPADMLIQNCYLDGSGNLSVNGTTLDWVQGGAGGTTLAGSGQLIVSSTGTLNIGGNGVALSQRTITNNGHVNFFATGDLSMSDGAKIDNKSTGVFDIQVDHNINGDGNQTFANAGLVKKSAGTGNAALLMSFNNSGTLDVQSGSVSIRYGVSSSPTIKTADNTVVDLSSGGGTTYSGTVTFLGTGTVLSGSGTVATTNSGATFVVPGTTSFSWGSTFYVPVNAALDFNGNLSLTSTGNMELYGGGSFVLSGNAYHTGSGTFYIGGDTSGTVPSTLTISANGSYNFGVDAVVQQTSGGGVIANNGAIRKNNGTGTSDVQVPITNAGTLQANKGTLAFRTITSTGGTLNSAPGATLQITDNGVGSLTESGALTISGAGTVLLSAGSLAASSNGATINIGSTTKFLWTGGQIFVPTGASASINGNWTTNFAAGTYQYFSGGGTLNLNGNIINNGDGDIYFAGNSGSPTKVNIAAGKTFTFAADGNLRVGSDGGGILVNNGTIQKSGGTGTSLIYLPLSQAAKIVVDTGTLTLAPPSGVIQGGAFTVAANATLNLSNNNSTTVMSGTFTGSGTGQIVLPGGAIAAAGGGAGLTLNFPTGLFKLLGGRLDTGGHPFNLTGSVMTSGTYDTYISGGDTFHLKGTLVHASTGTLVVDNGTVLSIESGAALNIAGDGDLAGGGAINVLGKLRKTSGTGLSVVNVAVTSSGTVEVDRGTLQFIAPISQIVSGTLTGGVWQAVSSATTEATLSLGASINKIGISAYVSLTGPNSTIPSLAGLATIAGSLNLYGGATFTTAAGLTSSGKMSLSPTSTLTVNGAFAQTSTAQITFTGTGASTIGKIKTTGSAVLAGKLVVAWAGTTKPAIGSTLTLFDNAGTKAVAGTFSGLAQNATFTASGMTFSINYSGGTGNDVVIKRTA